MWVQQLFYTVKPGQPQQSLPQQRQPQQRQPQHIQLLNYLIGGMECLGALLALVL